MADFKKVNIEEVIEKAKGGDRDSQISLGLMYELGLDVPANMKEAKKWWIEASKQGDPLASLSLAKIVDEGLDGNQPNKKLARTLYEKAAKSGLSRQAERINKTKSVLGNKVLIIDDSDTIRLTVTKLLVGEGFKVIEAANGEEGLKAFSANPDTTVIFCDIEMPVLNGIETLKKLRKTKYGKDVPVVMLTQSSQLELVKQAKEAGIQGWIIKPMAEGIVESTARQFSKSMGGNMKVVKIAG